MSDPATIDANVQTSTEQDGRVLTGVGEPSAALIEHMDRRASQGSEKAGGTAPTEPGAETGDPSPAPAAQEPKPSRGAQRFSDLTKERDDAKAETVKERTARETLEREVTELRARVQQAATPQQAAQAQTQLQQAEHQQAAQAQAAPGGFQFPDFEDAIQQYPNLTYAQWEMARLNSFADWRDAQNPIESRVQAVLAQERMTQAAQQTKESVLAKARGDYKDFDTLWTSGPGAGVIRHPEQVQAIYSHPQSHHILSAVLRDGDLARRLAQMGPMDFGMALERIAPRPAAQQAQQQAAPPAPYTPVGTGSSTANVPSSALAAKGNFDAYRQTRARERGVKSRYS